jgi:hypothetical protein
MTGARLIRLSGLSAIIGGVLIILARVSQVALFRDLPLSQQASSTAFVPAVGLPGFAGGLFLLLGVVGLYARQYDRHVTFGVVSFVIGFVGVALSNAANWLYAFGSPLLQALSPSLVDVDFLDPKWGVLGQAFLAAYLAGGIGWFFLGLHTLLAGRLPRWVALTMIASMALAAVLPIGTTGVSAILVNVLIAAGPFAFGYALWAGLTSRETGSA